MTNDKQTAEEAATRYGSGFGHGAHISKKCLAAIRKELEVERYVAFEAGQRWTKEQVIEFCRRRALECRPGKETGYVEGQSDAFGEVAAFLEGMK